MSRDPSKSIGGRGHPSPDRRLNAAAPPSVTLARRALLLWLWEVDRQHWIFLNIVNSNGTNQRHVFTAEAVFGVWGSVRELQCPEMFELRGASAASIPASGSCRRDGSRRFACSPAIVHGQKKPGGRCSRGQENDASRKGHSCRLIIVIYIAGFTVANLSLCMHNWVKSCHQICCITFMMWLHRCWWIYLLWHIII